MKSKRDTTRTNPPSQAFEAPVTIFADQPASMLVGPYVTKFTLGVADGDDSDYPRPVVTIAMPTVNLMRMVDDLQVLFSDPEFKADSAKMLAEDSKKHFGSKIVAEAETPRLPAKRVRRAIE